MRTRDGSKLLCHLIVGLCAVSILACPDEDDGYSMHRADIPKGTVSASAELTVVVPEGDWQLRILGAIPRDVNIREPGPSIEEDDSDCSGACIQSDYVLHCPRGKCRSVFDLTKRGESLLAAGIWLADENSSGCGDPDPNYVPSEDYGRLFEIRFAVRDVVLAPDAGVDGGFRADAGVRLDAGVFAAVGMGVDAGVRLDAGL